MVEGAEQSATALQACPQILCSVHQAVLLPVRYGFRPFSAALLLLFLSFPFSSFPLPSFCLSSSLSLFLKGSSCLYPLEFSEHSVKKPAFFTCAKISQGQERVDVKLKGLYKEQGSPGGG